MSYRPRPERSDVISCFEKGPSTSELLFLSVSRKSDPYLWNDGVEPSSPWSLHIPWIVIEPDQKLARFARIDCAIKMTYPRYPVVQSSSQLPDIWNPERLHHSSRGRIFLILPGDNLEVSLSQWVEHRQTLFTSYFRQQWPGVAGYQSYVERRQSFRQSQVV